MKASTQKRFPKYFAASKFIATFANEFALFTTKLQSFDSKLAFF